MDRLLTASLHAWKSRRNRKPLVLRGARQVGKTYLLQQFGREAFPNFHYVNFEDDEALCVIFDKNLNPNRIIEELKLYQETSIDRVNDLIIFDEIQRCPRALTSLKYFCEQLPEVAVCAAGSLLGVTFAGESFPVGKVTFLDLHPMTFEEFLMGIAKEQLLNLLQNEDFTQPISEIAHDRLWTLWKHYLIVGGLPESVKAYREYPDMPFEAFQAARDIQRDLLETYRADISKHSGKTNAMHIERVWNNAAEQLALAQDGSASKFRFKDVLPGVRSYERLVSPLNWLENAGLLIRTSIVDVAQHPLAAYSKENRFKQYYFDVGMLGAAINLSPSIIYGYDYGTYKGYFTENFVAQELIATGAGRLFSWEGKHSEIDFLVNTEEGIVPWEVKSGRATRSQSLEIYEKKFKPKKSFVLSGKNAQFTKTRQYVPIYAAGRMAKRILAA